jgi:integrase/recombinase XerD
MLSEATEKSYKGELARFEAYLKAPIKSASREQVEGYFHYLSTEKSSRGSLRSPATIHRAMACIRRYYHQLVLDGELIASPALWLVYPEQYQRKAVALTKDELSKIQLHAVLEEDTGIRDVAILLIFMHGLKAGEMQRLDVSDYREDESCLLVEGRNKSRLLQLSPATNRAVSQYMEWRKAEVGYVAQFEPLFISLSPRNYLDRLGYHGLYKKIKKICCQAGLPTVHPEMFRQTFAFQLADIEVHFLDALEVMGYQKTQSYRRFAKKYSTEKETMTKLHHEIHAA